jgi:polyhydroxyalkanoate synthesis repressor PhaR
MSETRIIKKYPNRRLYDTATSCYITLEDVKKLVTDEVDFQVVDAKTSQDLTRSILLQIIMEAEGEGQPMFSSDMLSQVIRLYGNAMQGMMGNFLEQSTNSFMEMQEQMQKQAKEVYGDNPVFNADMWGQFLKMNGPAIQNVMSKYMEQSTNMFYEMQQQMQKQTQNMFGNFPGFPGFPAQGGEAGKEPPAPGKEPKK